MNFNLKNFVIIFCLVLIPFIIYVHNLVPEQQEWKILIFNLKSVYFQDLNFVAWLLFSKVAILALLILWYYTNTHWWKYAILVPIILEIYKIAGIFNINVPYIDEDDFFRSLPITIPFILIIIYLARKVNYLSLSQQLLTDINFEADQMFSLINEKKQTEFNIIKKELEYLKSIKNQLSTKEYLFKLFELRDYLNNN